MTVRTEGAGRSTTADALTRAIDRLAVGPVPVAGQELAAMDYWTAARTVVATVTTVAVVAVCDHHRASPLTAALLSVVVVAYGVLSAIDVAERRLPNRITLPLAAGTAVAVLVAGVVGGDVARSLGALGLGLVFALAFLLLQFGGGDTKLALTIGMIAGWLGRDAVMTTAWVGAGAGASVAIALMLIHRRRDVSFSFGPFLAIGSLAGMLA